MVIQVSKFGTRLQGKLAGRKHYAEICNLMAKAKPGEIVFLDFRGVESVNGSWINMAVALLFRWCAESQNDFFPVLANFPTKDYDELELVAAVNQQCYPVARDANQPIRSLRLIGPLDAGLRATLVKLAELHEATGAKLSQEVPDAGILPTAWNNRLTDLYEKRLVLRRREGRQQIYFPVAEEVVFDG